MPHAGEVCTQVPRPEALRERCVSLSLHSDCPGTGELQRHRHQDPRRRSACSPALLLLGGGAVLILIAVALHLRAPKPFAELPQHTAAGSVDTDDAADPHRPPVHYCTEVRCHHTRALKFSLASPNRRMSQNDKRRRAAHFDWPHVSARWALMRICKTAWRFIALCSLRPATALLSNQPP